MFAIFEIGGFIASLLAAIVLWRRHASGILRVVVWGSWLALIWASAIGAVGIPLFLYRFRNAPFTAATVSRLAQTHHYLGHLFISAFVLFWPFLFVASVARPTSWLRKIMLGGAAIGSLSMFFLTSFAGYALPAKMPRELLPVEAAHALRFFVLHVLVAPSLAIVMLALILWRHARAASSAASLLSK
jgi:hypothetical protein